MMEFLRRTWEQIAAFFRRMPVPNRVALGALTAALVAVLVLFLSMGTRDNKVPLVWENIELAQADAVRKNLQEKGVPFEIRGNRIYVEPEQRDALLMQLYGEGIFQGDDAAIYKWIFEHDISETRGGRDLRWIVSRQSALAKMISSLDAVESAMVTITRQREELFQNEARMNAAVRLKLKSGKTLSDDTVLGIARWVAFSVQGMKPPDVAIMDTAGTMYPVPDENSPAMGSATQAKLIAAQEKAIEERVRKFLGFFLGNQLSVLARVQMNFDMEETSKDGPVETTESKIDKKTLHEESKSLEGEPGVIRENGPQGNFPVNPNGQGVAGTQTTKDLTESHLENEIPHEHSNIKKAPGQVKSVSFVIAAAYDRLKKPLGNRNAAVPDEDKQVKDNITELKTKLAGGLDLPIKGIEIIPASFDEPVPPEVPTTTQKTLWFVEQHWSKIGLVLLSLVALFFIWRVLRSAAPDDIQLELEKLRADVKAAEPPAEEEVLVPAGEEKTFAMKERIRDAVKQSPRNAASLLKRWITKG